MFAVLVCWSKQTYKKKSLKIVTLESIKLRKMYRIVSMFWFYKREKILITRDWWSLILRSKWWQHPASLIAIFCSWIWLKICKNVGNIITKNPNAFSKRSVELLIMLSKFHKMIWCGVISQHNKCYGWWNPILRQFDEVVIFLKFIIKLW